MTELEKLCCYYASAARTVDKLVDKGFSNLTREERIDLSCNNDYVDDALAHIREIMEPRIPEWLDHEKAKEQK